MSSKLAVQMYTIREFTKTARDLAGSLAKIKKIGYPAVQLSAVGAMGGASPEVSVQECRKMLDDNGLVCCATHRSWEDLSGNTASEIEFHQVLDCTYTAIGSLPKEYEQDHAAGYRRFLKEAVPVVAKLKAAGVRYGHHNHAKEFRREAGKTSTLMDILIVEGGPDFMLELDTYWVQHGGKDPAEIFDRVPGRVPVIHVKDREITLEDGPVFAPVGEGNLDWDAILAKTQGAGVE